MKGRFCCHAAPHGLLSHDGSAITFARTLQPLSLKPASFPYQALEGLFGPQEAVRMVLKHVGLLAVRASAIEEAATELREVFGQNKADALVASYPKV